MVSLNTRGTPSERGLKLKQRLLNSPYALDIERARYYTRVWREMEGSGPCMRAAKGVDETLRNMTIRIEEDELLVGVKSSKRRAEAIGVERGSFNGAFELMLNRKPSGGSGKSDGTKVKATVGGISSTRSKQLMAGLTDEEKRELLDKILPYWKDKTARAMRIEQGKKEGLYKGPPLMGPVSIYRIIKAMSGKKKSGGNGASKKKTTKPSLKDLKLLTKVPKLLKMLHGTIPDLTFLVLDMQGHIIPGYNRVFEIGFRGINEWAAKELAELEEGDADYEHKKDFLESVRVAANAVCDHSNRYADLADDMAKEAQGRRKAELIQIAGRCRHVPANPPRNFIEAVQSMWMTGVVLMISYGADNVFSPGRVDQYFYPYYKTDIEAGAITREQAVGVIEEFMIKLSDNFIFGPNNLTIGGVDQNGQDAVGEVSYMFLEALENIRGMGNGLAVRISPNTPRDFLLEACKVHRVTAGIAFYNDEVVIRDMKEEGHSIEDARNYSIVGCVEPTSTGNNFSYTAGNAIMLAGVLEMTLNRGRRILNGNRLVGAPTPDPRNFKTFEDLKNAFEEQLAVTVDKIVKMSESKDRVYSETFPSPLLSSTIKGCLESGKDITSGGALYNHGHVNAQALATVANSLAAIRWAVFEEKLVTMDELVRHLRNNFKGAENLRQKLIHRAPKYGNDDARADEIAEWVTEIFCREVRKHKCWRGGNYRPSLFSSGTQDIEGLQCIATPDGRLAGQVISNGISPANGTEINGATAVFHSAAVAGKSIVSDGTALNLNLSPGMLKSEENIDKLASLLEAYFKMGGRHVQFNPLDAETLRDAQAHPEKYPDLTVKVTGYSACFVDLASSLQNDIIARTEFREI